VWECSSCDEAVAVGSLDELEEFSGQRPTDLHKHVVDEIGWPCASCGGSMIRVPEVLDGWFESGSMPYAMLHYPFENAERFDAAFPAKFIAEGLDQTRGWFYTLLVLSTALFDKPAFENCVVNGLILAEDGRKMSKSLKNYPDPSETFDHMGADALRAFLINSPVLRAEPLRFSLDGVAEVVRTVLLPLWNTYSFFTTYAEADGITVADLELPPTLGFIDHLTNWYVRRSRRRFWRARGESGEGDADKLAAFATLYEVLTTFIEVLAPLLPFITEHLYQDLVARHRDDAVASVHHRDFPEAQPGLIHTGLEGAMEVVREVVRLGRNLRKKEGLRVRQPLARLIVLTRDEAIATAISDHAEVIADELNVKEVSTSADEGGLVQLSARANFRILGPRFGPKMPEAAAAIAALGPADLEAILAGGKVTISGEDLGMDDVIVDRAPREGTVVETGSALAVALDTTLSEDLVLEGVAREVISRVQRMRREAGLEVTDRINLAWSSKDETIRAALTRHTAQIAAEVLALSVEEDDSGEGEPYEVGAGVVTLAVNPRAGGSQVS
jgi:isoleucyl-tRNA synthetase